MSGLSDNRAHRVRTVREVIHPLHEGRAPGEVKAVGEWRLATPTVAEPALAAVEGMILRKERVLPPVALQSLTGDR